MKKENYFFVILTFLPILFSLILINSAFVYAEESQSQNQENLLSINKDQYFVNDEIEINVKLEPSVYSNYELIISSSSKQYKYKGDFNEIMFFYPTVEDIYTAALVEKATGAIYYQIQFTVVTSEINLEDVLPVVDNVIQPVEDKDIDLQEEILDLNSQETFEKSTYESIDFKSVLYLEKPVYYNSELVKLIFNRANCLKECQEALANSTLYYSNGISSEPYFGDLSIVQFVPRGSGLQELYLMDEKGLIFYSIRFNVLDGNKRINSENQFIKRGLLNKDLKNSLNLKKSDGFDSNSIIEISNSDGSMADLNEFENSPTGKEYVIDVVPFEGFVDSIKLRGVRKLAGQPTELRLEQIPLSSTKVSKRFSLKSFAIDPTSVNFSNGTVTSTAVGTELWKCKDWNFTQQNCFGVWQKLMDLSPGQQYSFEIDSLDPGFTETSPSTGTPDAGNSINIVSVNYNNGAFANTQTNDNVFMAAGRSNGGAQQLDPVGFLNYTYNLTLNASGRQIYNITVNISYCHSSDITAPTTCAALAGSATVNSASAQIFNFNINSYDNIGTVGLRNGAEGMTQFNVSPNYADYVNSLNQTNVRFGYNITITVNGVDGVLAIDYAPITIWFDRIYPVVNFTSPVDNSGSVFARNYTHINVTANDTFLRNITIFVYNSTGDLVNSSNISTTTLLVQSLFFNLTNLLDGLYFFNATACDMVSNCNDTETRNITIDTINPNILFNDNSEISGIYVSRNSTVINITITDANLNYSTIYLYNATGALFNTTNSTNSTWQINYTDLPDGLYFFNASAVDLANNSNVSETRNITLDRINPHIVFNPRTATNGGVFLANFFVVNISIIDANINYSTINVYDSAGELVNSTNTSDSTFEINFTSLNNGIFFYNVTSYDLALNYNSSFTRNVTLDTGAPHFIFNPPTPADSAFVSATFVEVNVTIVDPLAFNLSIDFYNSTGARIANATTNTSIHLFINVTGLINGIYFYNASGCDLFGNCNNSETRNVTIFFDSIFPSINYDASTEVSGSLLTRNSILINVTASDANFRNLTIYLYNSTFELVNITNTSLTRLFVNYSELPDGLYFFNASACDLVENCNFTQTRNVTIDLNVPSVYYDEASSDPSGIYLTRNYTHINVSALDVTFKNITIRIFNSLGILVRNISSVESNLFFNATDLLDGLYYINATACDFTNKCNTSFTRNITIDATYPQISFVPPTDIDGLVSIKNYLEINVSVFDIYIANLSLSVYDSLGSLVYYDNTSGLSIYANVTPLSPGTYYYNATACDLLDQCSISETRSFTVEPIPLFDPVYFGTREGLFVYGLGTVQNPYYRFWNGSEFGIQQNASAVGGTIERIRLGHSSTRYEYLLLTTDSGDDINVQMYSYLPNGTLCWNDGLLCGNTFELTATSGAINRLKGDVSYEYNSGDAMVVYANATTIPFYRTWNGTDWSSQQAIPQTHLGGVISYVKMAAKPFSNEIALIMTNTTRVNILIWNGTDWDCEPASAITSSLTPDVFQHADLAYEKESGDLFVAAGLDVTTEIDYITKENGTCTFNTAQTTTLLEEGEYVSVSAQPDSDNILIGQYDIGGNDLHAIVWNGSAMLAVSGNEPSLYATDTSPRELFDVAWAGKSPYGLLLYSDVAPSLQLSYFLYNATDGNWLGGTTGLTPSGLTPFTDEEEQILTYSFIEENRTFVFVKTEADLFWAKYYDANTDSWFDADGGATLGSPGASVNFKSYDFTWKISPTVPVLVFSPPTELEGSHINRSFAYVNVSANDTNYAYMNFNFYNSTFSLINSTQTVQYSLYAMMINLVDGMYFYNVSACDLLGNCNNSALRNFTVDTIYPSIQFNTSTDISGSYLARNYTQINVSTTELNLRNLTIFVYNSTGQLINLSNTTSPILYLNLSLFDEGIYFFNATACDYAENCNSTPTRNITIDLFVPQINFTTPTHQNGTIVNESWIVINASANDTNYANMTISIYNSTGLFARNFTLLNNLTWNRTLGNQGYYFFNATACDLSGRCINTSTGIIYADFFIPSVGFVLPTEGNNSYTNRTIIFINATASDFSFRNLTIRVYNSTNDLVNFSNTTATNLLINLSDLAEGIYFFNATACDFLDKCNSTSTRRVTIDLTNPNITFSDPTDSSGSILNRSYIIINLTTFDNYGIANLTFYLYNTTGSLINTTFNSSSNLYFNISNLSDGLYFFNASTIDFAGNTNWTETRNVTIGSQGPIITLNYPQNNSYINVSIIHFNYSVFDAAYSIANCTLYIDGIFNETNMTIIEYENQYFFDKNLSQGWHNWSISCENFNSVISNSSVYNFYIDSIAPIANLISPLDLEIINPQDINMTYMVNASVVDASNVTVFYQYRFNSTDSWLNICNNSIGPPYNCTWNLQNLLYGENYQVRVYAIDIAGNQGPFDSSVDVFINASLFVNITSVFVDDDLLTPINQIDLIAGSRKTINCNISATDALHYAEINLNVTFRSMTVAQNSNQDNRTYYVNNSCTRTYGFERNAEFMCGFNVIYYAINETWVCDVTAWNNYTITNRSDNTTMNQLFALNISTENMDYSALPAGQTSPDINVNVTNIGNVPMNLSVFGYGGDDEASGLNLSYLCDINNISVSFHKFSTTVLPYDSKTNLSSTPQPIGLTIPPQTNETDPRHNSTYWQLQVPGTSYAFGNCNGSVVFMATPSY